MTKPFLLLATLTLGLLASAADAGPGDGSGSGTGGRAGAGKEGHGRCGSALTVVLPDGSERSFAPASDLLEGLPMRQIDQGEEPRNAAKLTELLGKVGATWVKAQDCAGNSQDLPSGLPAEGEIYAVITGRGSLKFVREVRPGIYANLIHNVSRLRFHAPGDAGEGRRSRRQR